MLTLDSYERSLNSNKCTSSSTIDNEQRLNYAYVLAAIIFMNMNEMSKANEYLNKLVSANQHTGPVVDDSFINEINRLKLLLNAYAKPADELVNSSIAPVSKRFKNFEMGEKPVTIEPSFSVRAENFYNVLFKLDYNLLISYSFVVLFIGIVIKCLLF